MAVSRFTVHRRPTLTPNLGDYAIISRQTGRIAGRAQNYTAARASANARDRGVRRAVATGTARNPGRRAGARAARTAGATTASWPTATRRVYTPAGS